MSEVNSVWTGMSPMNGDARQNEALHYKEQIMRRSIKSRCKRCDYLCINTDSGCPAFKVIYIGKKLFLHM